mgnify:CR=1 FL=1
MVAIVSRNVKGHEYLYLVESIRSGKKVIQKNVKYIGKKRPVREEEFECMKFSHEKRDWVLNEFNDSLSYQDHNQMRLASKKNKEYLSSLDSVSKEKEREIFLSKMIANTNAIEGSTMTQEETFRYLFDDTAPKGHSKKELHMAENLLKAWDYVEQNFKRFPSKEDILHLHSLVNRDIEDSSTIGKYKKVQNYVGGMYTSSYLFVEERMSMLLKWIKKAYKEVNDFEVAFQSHAQFEIIHPFVDGNGRVGRLLLNWLLMHKGLSPLIIRNSKRDGYILCLNFARRSDLRRISEFCFNEYLENYKFV